MSSAARVASLGVMGQSRIAQGLRALLLGAVGQNCWARATICAADTGSGVGVVTGVGVGVGVAAGVAVAVGRVVPAPAPTAHPARMHMARTASSAVNFRLSMGLLGSQAARDGDLPFCRYRLVAS